MIHYVKKHEGTIGEWESFECHMDPEEPLDFSRLDYRLLSELGNQQFDCDSTFRVIDSIHS